MTIEHLLEMKSGFDCEEWDGSKDCEDDMENTKDWIKFCLDLPLKNKPGTHWDYTSINAMLLGGIIAHATHMTVSDFADKYLFKPLGITNYKWTKDPLEHETTAGSFYISPGDMNKIGQLVLNDGVVFASGNGGQYIMVIKDLQLVVTFAGNSYNSSKSKLPFDIMIKYILPYFDQKARTL